MSRAKNPQNAQPKWARNLSEHFSAREFSKDIHKGTTLRNFGRPAAEKRPDCFVLWMLVFYGKIDRKRSKNLLERYCNVVQTILNTKTTKNFGLRPKIRKVVPLWIVRNLSEQKLCSKNRSVRNLSARAT